MKPILLLLFIASLSSCRPAESRSDVAIQRLVPLDSIDLTPRGIYSVSALHLSDSVHHILDRGAKTLFWTTPGFETIGSYSAIGNGPGEFSSPSDLQVTQNHIFLIDFGQRKVMRFGRDLTPQIDLVTEHPPLSILSLDDRTLWMGTLDMEFEDVYLLDLDARTEVLQGPSAKIRHAPEGIVFHSMNSSGTILRYRQYNHRLDVFDAAGKRTSFVNPVLPERPELDPRSPEAPIFTSKIHHSGFVTADRACVLSGDHSPKTQPMHCFSFDGTLVGRFILTQDPSMISTYLDSTLYTYSSKTNHIYVYDLGF